MVVTCFFCTLYESTRLSILIETSLSAHTVLECCHRLANPALLYSGTSGSQTGTSATQASAVLAFQPEKTVNAQSPAQLQQLLLELKAHSAASANSSGHFQSGWLGYFSYDAGVALQDVATEHTSPLAEFHYYPFSLRLDMQSDRCFIQNPLDRPESHAGAWLAPLEALCAQQMPEHEQQQLQQPDWQPVWSQQQYNSAFHRVKEYLVAGDAYQVNLTMPFRCSQDLTRHNPLTLLKRFNAPFSCYFKTDALTLFSVTPERFIRIDNQLMTTSPIKGTIPRGNTDAEDQHNKEWLQHSEKNQAENLMIVDLLRNDLGRSAEAGSVNVTRLFDIESHANVHHMVSTIQASKPASIHRVDAIMNAFPGGSITGAPKKRAMEIIQELEVAPRSLYCGSLGYFDDAELTDFNILIRSIIATPSGAECWGGGGLVMDSTADSEYEEIHNKVDRILETRFQTHF